MIVDNFDENNSHLTIAFLLRVYQWTNLEAIHDEYWCDLMFFWDGDCLIQVEDNRNVR